MPSLKDTLHFYMLTNEFSNCTFVTIDNKNVTIKVEALNEQNITKIIDDVALLGLQFRSKSLSKNRFEKDKYNGELLFNIVD